MNRLRPSTYLLPIAFTLSVVACGSEPTSSGTATDTVSQQLTAPGATKAPAAAAALGDSIADLALKNLGDTACGKNSDDQTGYMTSCGGNEGQPEYWCADFARWTWFKNDVKDTSQLTAGAASFFAYGKAHGTLHDEPAAGDAVLFDCNDAKDCTYAQHVAIVTRVNADDTIVTVSGDWGGCSAPDCQCASSQCEANFARSSHVRINLPAYADTLGKSPAPMGMKISKFVSPVR